MYHSMYREMYYGMVVRNCEYCVSSAPNDEVVDGNPVRRYYCVNEYCRGSSQSMYREMCQGMYYDMAIRNDVYCVSSAPSTTGVETEPVHSYVYVDDYCGGMSDSMCHDLFCDMYYEMAVTPGECCDSNIPTEADVAKEPDTSFCGDNDYIGESSESDSDGEPPIPVKRRKSEPVNKYKKIFRTYAFIEDPNHKTPHPQCMICGIVLPNNCMKLRRLRKHFMTKHRELYGKPPNVFEKYLAALRMKQENPQ